MLQLDLEMFCLFFTCVPIICLFFASSEGFFFFIPPFRVCIPDTFRHLEDGITLRASPRAYGPGVVGCQRQVQAAPACLVAGQRLQQLVLLVAQQDGRGRAEESTRSFAAAVSVWSEQNAAAAVPSQPGHTGQGERVPGAVGGVLQLPPVHIGPRREPAGWGAAHHAHRAGI